MKHLALLAALGIAALTSGCVAVPISPIGSPTPGQALYGQLSGRTFVAEAIAYTMTPNGILRINAFGSISNGTWSTEGNLLCFVTPPSGVRSCQFAQVFGSQLTITDPASGFVGTYPLS